MHRRHSRAAALAAAVVILSAGSALASPPLPGAAAAGLGVAAGAAGKLVPVGAPVAPTAETLPAEVDDPAEEGTDSGVEDIERPDNHGAVVSTAARAETPAGWKNHGAYVSSVARGAEGTAAPTAGKGHGQERAAAARSSAKARQGHGD